MLKWILRFFYIMIISVATLYVYGSANYGRLEAYYKKYMTDEINNDAVYLKGINTLMNLEYYQETPVYTFLSTSETHRLKVSIHAMGIVNDGVYYDGMMIFVNQLEIYENNQLVEKPILKMTAHLSDKTYKLDSEYVDSPSVIYDSTKEFPYSYAPTLFLLYAKDYLLIPNENPEIIEYTSVDRISIAYSNGTRGDDGQYVFNSTLLFAGSDIEIPEAAYNKATDLTLEESSFRLTHIFGTDLSSEEIEALGLITDRGQLKEFNGVIIKSMVIYTLIVIALTYVLFFHKLVVEKIKEKRFDKQNVVKTVGKEQEAIFQDIETPENDKKK